MLDERLKTRNESCSTSSPTLRHSREGGNLPRTTSRKSSSWKSAGPIGSIILFFLAITLVACTDYVQQMDDGFDEWEQTQKQKTLSSSNQTEKSSCSEKAVSSSSKKNESDNTISSPNEKPISSSKEEKIVETSSSSAVIELPCKTKNNDNCVYGIIKDSRDGQEYKTVTIGSQIWMAQNLNTKVDSSYCVGQTEYGCTTYGRLYTWAAAIDSIGKFSNNLVSAVTPI